MTYLDTHMVAMLVHGSAGRLPARARRLLESTALLISPMVVIELGLLYEIGRLRETEVVVVSFLVENYGLRICDLPFVDVAREACRQTWTRDPFDRLIVAQAAIRQAPLLTRDERVLAHYPLAVAA